ncbi:general secretion pathway protein GspL [Pseudomonas sp. NFXW11]|uniref:type II secretion system protein GspL n=1 Tax=Pseudomonas sp. NFXW11 TaxID=2819531 RepID=UPI003CF6905E
MSHWLYLSPHATEATSWHCCWWQSNGPLHQGDLAQAAADLRGQAPTLLLPMEMASYHQVSLPVRSRRWLRQALHSALEEQLIDELDELHIAHGPLQDKHPCAVLVLNRARLRHCLERLAELGLQPGRIHIDADCLPQDQPRALAFEGRWLLGGAAPMRLVLGQDDLASLAPRLPPALQWQGPQPPELEGFDPGQWQLDERPWDSLSLGSQQAIDLRQGDFLQRARPTAPWRLALLVLVLAAGAQLLQGAGQRWHLERQSDQLQASSLALWQERFADAGPVTDLAAQIHARQQMQVEESPGSAHKLSRLAEQWSNSHGALAQVQRIDYQSGEGWSLQVSAPAFADLQQLREGLVAQGLDASTDSSVRDALGVSARLQIKE